MIYPAEETLPDFIFISITNYFLRDTGFPVKEIFQDKLQPFRLFFRNTVKLEDFFNLFKTQLNEGVM